jgi:hypothetical protein
MQARDKERLWGVGSAFVFPWVFRKTCEVIDWISRGQTVMALDSNFVTSVITSRTALVLSPFIAAYFLYRATKLELAREKDDAPRILLPWRQPEPINRKLIWIKRTIAVAVLAVVSAVVFAAVLFLSVPEVPRYNPRIAVPSISQPPLIRPSSSRSPSPREQEIARIQFLVNEWAKDGFQFLAEHTIAEKRSEWTQSGMPPELFERRMANDFEEKFRDRIESLLRQLSEAGMSDETLDPLRRRATGSFIGKDLQFIRDYIRNFKKTTDGPRE